VVDPVGDHRPLLDLVWDYEMEGDEPSSEDVLRQINGIDLTTGRAVNSYLDLKADGTTACGCWIYSGVYADDINQAARRKPHDEQGPYESEWGWTWPMNRRVLYNRAGATSVGGRGSRGSRWLPAAHMPPRRECWAGPAAVEPTHGVAR
jgi:formate dehydrogenase major subunit